MPLAADAYSWPAIIWPLFLPNIWQMLGFGGCSFSLHLWSRGGGSHEPRPDAQVWAMIVKELWAVLRDPRARIMLIVPPLLQLFIFGFASTLEVKNIDIGHV